MYMSQVFRDIKQALGPLMKELGVRHRLVEPEPERYHRVIFETMGDFRWRAPVELQFPIAGFSGKTKADWADVRIWHQRRPFKPVGSNGWITYDEIPTSTIGPLLGSKDRAIRIVRRSLPERELIPNGPPFPEGPGLPNILLNMWLKTQLERTLARFFEAHEVENFYLHRNAEGEESVSFELRDYTFEILYLSDDRTIVVSVDGEERERDNMGNITDVLVDQLGRLPFSKPR